MEIISPIIWITGLSGSGKTELGKELTYQLNLSGKKVVFLDGDEMRNVFINNENEKLHSRKERLNLAIKYTNLARLIARQGYIVIVSTISLFKEIHQRNKLIFPKYFEVFFKLPITVLQNRDPKGIYKRFKNGKLKNVMGLDIEIDEPSNPDILISNPNLKSSLLAQYIIEGLTKKGLI